MPALEGLIDLLRYLVSQRWKAGPSAGVASAVRGPDYGDQTDYLTDPWLGYGFSE